jgi:hypothetical protein
MNPLNRRPPILLHESVSAADVPHIEPGTRVLLIYCSAFTTETLPDVLAIENVSGWVVEADYRPTGGLILSGTDWRGNLRTMPVAPSVVRVAPTAPKVVKAVAAASHLPPLNRIRL